MTRKSKSKSKPSYWGVYADGRAATGSTNKKREAQALAALISMRGIGVGRKVCIMQRSSSGDKPTGECFEKGILYKDGKARPSPF
jgi:hypothetical protein